MTGGFVVLLTKSRLYFNFTFRLMNLLIDDIKTFREFPLRNSRVCRFSCGGHLLAAVSEKDIAVYSTINFKRVVSESLSIVVLIELY